MRKQKSFNKPVFIRFREGFTRSQEWEKLLGISIDCMGATIMSAKKNLLAGKLSAVAFVLLLLLIVGTQTFAQEQQDTQANADLTQMSLEELMNIEVSSTATLTKTSRRLEPAAVTTITKEDIWMSGARSLNELFDIYVPNVQLIRHHWEGDHLGIRGILQDEKYLLLVNGEKIDQGAERDLTLLQDIHHIDVVRGPGSAQYGPGAISMVINIVTDNPDTFQGTEITNRIGAIEEFYSTELKHGQKFDDNDGGILFYGGIAKYVGADQDAAPQIFSTDFPDESDYSAWWDPAWGEQTDPDWLPSDSYESGEPYDQLDISRDGATHRNLPPLKAHLQIKRDDWDIWTRYSRGGQQFAWDIGPLIRYPWGWGDWVGNLDHWSYGYQQASVFVGHKEELSDNLTLNYSGSYDMFDRERYQSNKISDAFRTDEYQARAVLNWDFSERDKLALGGEFYHWELGFPSPGWPSLSARSSTFVDTTDVDGDPDTDDPLNEFGLMPRWSANMYSLFGEVQKSLGEHWTTFLGARLDDHSDTDLLFSPRAALVYSPDNLNALKLLWSRSVRTNGNDAMKRAKQLGAGDSPAERLYSYEIRYESIASNNLNWAASVFYHDLDIIALMEGTSGAGNQLAGTQQDYGIEIEAAYHTDKFRISASHSYTKLINFKLNDSGTVTFVTAEPYGFGDDLAFWSSHITKLNASYLLTDRWTLNGSMRIYWGFPGTKDYHDYDANPLEYTGDDYRVVEPGWEKDSRGSYYLNMGLQYKATEDLTARVDGYYLLGIFNSDLNKRGYWAGYGDYRSHAAAIGVSLKYKF